MFDTRFFKLIVTALLAMTGAARADETSAGALAQNLAPTITEVANGGSWTDGKDTGFYRAVVVNEPGAANPAPGNDVAYVFLQWVTYRNGTSEPHIVMAVPVKEVNALALPNAFLTIDAEKDNQAILTVSSFDPQKEGDQNFTITAALPGKYDFKAGADEQ